MLLELQVTWTSMSSAMAAATSNSELSGSLHKEVIKP